MSYDRLLVPVDGSDSSHTAVREALALAGVVGASVDVVHVVESGRGAAVLGGREHAEILEDRGRAFLATVDRMADEESLDVTSRLLAGVPHQEILAYAAERGADLVVMGRSGAGTVASRMLGGVTERVLRAGVRPVLSVRAAEDVGGGLVAARQVLLPTDGSDCAEQAADHAIHLAELAGAGVHVVSAVDVEADSGPLGRVGLPPAFVRTIEGQSEEAVARLAGDVGSATDVPVETAVVRGPPSAVLRDYAEGNDVDVVVLGAHGRSGVQRWMLGSVTERLLRTVDGRILVVPCHDGDRSEARDGAHGRSPPRP